MAPKWRTSKPFLVTSGERESNPGDATDIFNRAKLAMLSGVEGWHTPPLLSITETLANCGHP